MGYNERNPIFSFRLGEYRHGKLLRLSKLNKMPANDFLRSILDQYLAGDLIPKAKDDLAVEMAKLKLQKLKAEIEYLKLKNKYMETFGAPMSTSATRILKPQIIADQPQKQIYENPQSPYDAANKRLQCIDCGALFTWESYTHYNIAISELQRHLVAKHNRVKTEIEKDVLLNLKYEGASK